MQKLGWVVAAALAVLVVLGAVPQGQGAEAQKLDEIRAVLEEIRFVESVRLHKDAPASFGRDYCDIVHCLRRHIDEGLKAKAEGDAKKK